ncbi:MAG: pyridoxamine 5'-phosphate oxidase family protein [Bacillota bacterium]
MFRTMRRAERGLDSTGKEAVLRDGKYGVLSISGGDYPYGVPLNYAADGDNIYLHMALEGLKLELLRKSPKVSFCVVSEAEPLPESFSMVYKSAIVFGVAEELCGDEKNQALELLIRKYSADHLERGREYIKNAAAKTVVFKLKIEHSSGKSRAA